MDPIRKPIKTGVLRPNGQSGFIKLMREPHGAMGAWQVSGKGAAQHDPAQPDMLGGRGGKVWSKVY